MIDIEHSSSTIKSEIAKLRKKVDPNVPFLYSELKRCKECFTGKDDKLTEMNKLISHYKNGIDKYEMILSTGYDRMNDEIGSLNHVKESLEKKLDDIQKSNQEGVKSEAINTSIRNSEAEEKIKHLVFNISKLKNHVKALDKTIKHLKYQIVSLGLKLPKQL